MTNLWIVEVTRVDRIKREICFGLLRVYPGWELPRSYNFFCAMLHSLFTDRGLFGVEQLSYEGAGLVPRPGEPPDGLEYDGVAANNNSRQFIEHVEMLRWCGPDPLTIEPITRKTRSGTHVDYSARNAYEEETQYMLQAEYLVRVTDEAYISTRADPPSFLGNFFFDTAMYNRDDDGNNTHIALGPRQTDALIYPLDQFIISAEESQAATRYANENMSTMEQLVAAVPKVLRKAPAAFSTDSFHDLSLQDQRLMLSLLAFAKRNDGNVFNMLPDRSMLFQIFSFVPIDDSQRQAELRQIYLSLEQHAPFDGGQRRWLLRALNEASMKHCAVKNLLSSISYKAEQIDTALTDGADAVDLLPFHERALEFGQELQRTLDGLDRLVIPSFIQLCLGRDPIEWMRQRLRAFQNRTSAAEFWQHIYDVPPDHLHHPAV